MRNKPCNLITINLCDEYLKYRYQKLEEVTSFSKYSILSDMFIVARPSFSNIHVLHVKLFKTNGEIVEGDSDALEWM